MGLGRAGLGIAEPMANTAPVSSGGVGPGQSYFQIERVPAPVVNESCGATDTDNGNKKQNRIGGSTKLPKSIINRVIRYSLIYKVAESYR